VVFSGRPPWWQALRKTGQALTVVVAVLITGLVQAKDQVNQALGSVTLAQLPVEAQSTHGLILAGGPFPHHKDGTVFGNRERVLPARPRGFYHEYTVRTPGSRDRGARRIVCGGAKPKTPEACFYTEDHYTSFRQIVQ
jgi:ribonuclease T1